MYNPIRFYNPIFLRNFIYLLKKIKLVFFHATIIHHLHKENPVKRIQKLTLKPLYHNKTKPIYKTTPKKTAPLNLKKKETPQKAGIFIVNQPRPDSLVLKSVAPIILPVSPVLISQIKADGLQTIIVPNKHLEKALHDIPGQKTEEKLSPAGPLANLLIRDLADTEKIKPTQTFFHRFKIYNKSSVTLHFKLTAAADKRFRPFTFTDKFYELAAGDSLVAGIKYLNAAARVNGNYKVAFNLVDAGNSSYYKTLFFNVLVYNGTNQDIMAHALTQEVALMENTKTFDLPVLFKNNLGDAKNIYLAQQYIDRSAVLLNKPNTKFIKLPGQDTIINLHFSVPGGSDGLKRNENGVMVSVMDEAGKQLAVFTFNIRWLFSRGFVILPGAKAPAQRELSIESTLRYSSNVFSSGLIAANSLPANTNGLGFNLYYEQSLAKTGYNAFGGNLQYRYGNYDVQLGNVGVNHELNLYGQGLALTAYLDSAKKYTLEAWAAKQQGVLSGQNNWENGSEIYSFRFTGYGAGFKNQLVFSSSYFNRADNDTRGVLNFASFKRKVSKNQDFMVLVGGSQSQLQQTGRADSSLHGFVAKLNYNNYGQTWEENLAFTSGTANYAGINQGRMGMLALIRFLTGKKTSLSFLVNKNTSEIPMYNDTLHHSHTYTSNTIGQLKFNFNNNILPFSVTPYLFDQKILNVGLPASMASEHIMVDFYKTFGQVKADINADEGSYNYQLKPGENGSITGFKVNMGLYIKNFNLNIIDQYGPYYVYDLLAQATGGKGIHNQALNLTYNLGFFNKIKWQAVFNVYSSNVEKGLNTGISQRAEIKLGKGWLARVTGNYFKQGATSPNNQFEVGLRKTVNWQQAGPGTVSLHLTIFEDMNNDAIKQPDEKLATGLQLMMDNLQLITDEKGMALIKNLKRGEHTLKIIYGNFSQQNFIEKKVFLLKNQAMQYGIPPQFLVSGAVMLDISKFEQTAVDLEGIHISFRDGAGNEFSTFTGPAGVFSLKLPGGSYRVYFPDRKTKGDQAVAAFFVDKVKGYNGRLLLKIAHANGREVEMQIIKKKD